MKAVHAKQPSGIRAQAQTQISSMSARDSRELSDHIAQQQQPIAAMIMDDKDKNTIALASRDS